MSKRTNNLTLKALLIAMCIVGANFKVLGSIALDAFPAFLGAIILGPVSGAVIGFFGHMVSAALSGFALTLPIHLIIATLMAACMFSYGWIRCNWKEGTLTSVIVSLLVAYIINVPLDLLLLYPMIGKVVYGLFVPLTIGTVANLFLTEIVYVMLPKKFKQLMTTHN